MRFAADMHVHLYPCHNLQAAVAGACRNLSALIGKCAEPGGEDGFRPAVFLTERADCHVFLDLRDGRAGGGGVQRSAEAAAITVASEGLRGMYVFAGRQVVTRERLEVLALTADESLPDDRPMGETIDAVLAFGGIPVLPWSPGKWLGKRGKIVREAIARYGPGRLLLGDNSLRPRGWPEPLILRRSGKNGFRVVAGSDPLPFAGEERRIGTYGIVFDLESFDPVKPVTEMRRALTDPAVRLCRRGKRGSAASVLRRLILNHHSPNRRGGMS